MQGTTMLWMEPMALRQQQLRGVVYTGIYIIVYLDISLSVQVYNCQIDNADIGAKCLETSLIIQRIFCAT